MATGAWLKLLENPIRGYAWGSHTAIARLQGRPAPTVAPEAELWIGAHADDPSRVDGIGLDKRIASDPAGLLGGPAASRFGPRLPFLLKYLAAAAPLSIQVHPDAARARAGFARHAYVDAYHKPEMLLAREPFEALCGFRDPGEVASELGALGVPSLEPVVRRLAAGEVRAALAAVLTLPRASCRVALALAFGRRARLPAERADLLKRLFTAYRDDPGVFVALMMRRYPLAPGEAIYVAPGQLHSYVRGVGIETMASSDNVIRGGLTGKPVDVDELMSIVSVEPAADARLAPVTESATVTTWDTPADDFRLRWVRHPGDASTGATETELTPAGPRVVFCVDGSMDATDADGAVTLRPGAAAFGAAGAGPIHLRGTGEVFVASL